MLKDKRREKPDHSLTAVTLFSGCGGLDLGFHRAGFSIQFALDSDSYCAESYRRNFPTIPFHTVGIEQVPDSQFRRVRRDAGGEISVLFGGPPCPPYSKSRFYRKEKPRALADDIGEKTATGFLRALRLLKPSAFLMENVPGLAYNVHRAALDFIVGAAESFGYTCEHGVLNAADFGVPQIRQRFFLVGLKDGSRFQFPSQTHRNPSATNLSSVHLPAWRTAGDVILDLDTGDELPGHRAGGKHYELLRKVPPGDNYLFFTEKRGHAEPQFRWRSRYWSFLLKLSPSLPSWTIQARRSNNMGPFHWRSRILTIPEVKRLQTFPDEWYLSGTVERQWRQLGNAVPPLLAEALARQLRTHLEGETNPLKKTTPEKRTLARKE